MRLAFMGTSDFAVPALEALVAAGHEVAAVYSQPPRPAGRGKRLRPSPVHEYAEEAGLELRTPASLKDPVARDDFAALGLDVAVVASYGLILPDSILRAPKLGCINIHASLLPRWRGAAPIERAIMAGDGETGISIMQMDAGLDTGDLLRAEGIAVAPEDTAGTLAAKLAALGAKMIVDVLEELAAGALTPTPQPEDGATYAKKIDKAEARIDWTSPASDIDRLVRAMNPAPGAWFEVDGTRIKILAGEISSARGAPGEVLDNRLTIACGEGAYRAITVQRAGKGAMAATDMLRGTSIATGKRLEARTR
ncbi:MAG: methionyl-tRNA formyltransferase [Proteobacteria bacterium]|nr:methionyl-tRNA formyltransferase [Pseudomonadota bacterium]